MSIQGKLIRGLKYNLSRDNEGVLPKGVSGDPSKMSDVNYYTEFLETRDPKKVKKILLNLRSLGRGSKGKSSYRKALEVLNSDELLKKVVSKKGGR